MFVGTNIQTNEEVAIKLVSLSFWLKGFGSWTFNVMVMLTVDRE